MEDQQIAYDRKCREELKVLEQNKQKQLKQIRDDAEEEIEDLKDKIKNEVQAQTKTKKKGIDEKRKKQL